MLTDLGLIATGLPHWTEVHHYRWPDGTVESLRSILDRHRDRDTRCFRIGVLVGWRVDFDGKTLERVK